MVYVFLADGFEEMEFTIPVDILRRAGVDVTTVGIGKKLITGAHDIKIQADILDKEIIKQDFEMIVLPGGMPGSTNLDQSDIVDKFISTAVEKDKYIAAICAAPFVLGKRDILQGKNAVCFPGFEKYLNGAIIVDQSVVVDGKIITAKGAGVAFEFGLELVKLLKGEDISKKLKENMQCKCLI